MTQVGNVTGNSYMDADYQNQLLDQLNTQDSWGTTANTVGGNLESAEAKLLTAITDGNQTEIMKKQVLYDKAVRVFSTLQTLSKNMHEMLMNLIRNMSVR